MALDFTIYFSPRLGEMSPEALAKGDREVELVIQRKTTMQAVRALGYSPVTKEGKVFEKISEILGSLLFEGTELGSADVSVTLRRNGTSVAHIEMRSEADGSSKITSAMVDEKFYPTIEPLLAQYKPDYQQVYDFSNVAQGGWSTD